MAIEQKKVSTIRSFTCPACGGQVTLRAGSHTLIAICAHCSSTIDTADERFELIKKFETKNKQTLIEMGARGELKGVVWECIGYVQKSDKSGQYLWDEYLLFNPYHGFRFLVQMDGHWNFVTIIKRSLAAGKHSAEVWLGDDKFRRFLRDSPIVTYVKGEFYWRVKKGDRAETIDYIAPPLMLSVEEVDGEKTVSLCEYTEPSAVKDAFALKFMPRKVGISPNQPNDCQPGKLLRTAGIAALAAIILYIVTSANSSSAVVFNHSAPYTTGDRTKTFDAGTFEAAYPQNVLIEAWSPVSNQWTEIALSLSDEKSQKTYNLRQAIEYYHGSSGGESWSEGGVNESDYISSIEPGVYKMLYEVDSGYFTQGQDARISIKVIRDKPSIGNLFGTLLMLLAYPGIMLLRRGAFETKRWQNSDSGGS